MTGSRPTSTRVSAGNDARAHSPSLVISNTLTAKVSQPNGRISKVAGISLSTSTNTSRAALSAPGTSSGRYTLKNNPAPPTPRLRDASGSDGRIRSRLLSSGP